MKTGEKSACIKASMRNDRATLLCPRCHHSRFVVKYEASHVYSYAIDSDAPGRRNADEFLSFLYDKRELTKSDQYVECQSCGAKYPCSFSVWNDATSLEELQAAINNYNK